MPHNPSLYYATKPEETDHVRPNCLQSNDDSLFLFVLFVGFSPYARLDLLNRH